MKYQAFKQDDADDNIAAAIIGREQEYHNYDLNKDNYLAMLTKMAEDKDLAYTTADPTMMTIWPDNIASFKGLGTQQLADVLHGDDYALAAKLQFRDQVIRNLKTTITEQAKGESVHAALLTQLSDKDRLAAAILRVQEKQTARALRN